jgi:alanine racemase
LACADEKDHFMNQHQLDNFKRIREKYFADVPACLSASDGAFLGADYAFDMVRLGAAVYGINTAPYRPNQMKNVVTVKAPILQIADLAKGEFVGYSATYRAGMNRRIAIVSIGYGDGLPRSLSNVGKVFFRIKGKMQEARIIGRVSMDNVICDVTDIEDLKVGDWGYLIFDDYTLDDIARDAGTISYEILSRIGKNPRFRREYLLQD